MIRPLLMWVVLAQSVVVDRNNAVPQAVEPPLPVYHARFPARIPLPARKRTFVPPESVGVEKSCPFPAVKDPVCFQCPTCGLKMKTQVLYPHLPHCPKDRWVMNEIEQW